MLSFHKEKDSFHEACRVLLCLVSFLIIPHAAAAADGLPVEMSGGYAYLYDQDAASTFRLDGSSRCQPPSSKRAKQPRSDAASRGRPHG